jgi:hypothetical protein
VTAKSPAIRPGFFSRETPNNKKPGDRAGLSFGRSRHAKTEFHAQDLTPETSRSVSRESHIHRGNNRWWNCDSIPYEYALIRKIVQRLSEKIMRKQ